MGTHAASIMEEPAQASPEIITEKIVELLHRLPSDVLQFIQFMEYKSMNSSSEDYSLWDAVQVNKTYKAQHPNEKPERYKSGEEFLKAVADL